MTQTMNKLNDVQAAAWFKDQKILKINTEQAELKKKLALQEKEFKSDESSLHKVEEQNNMLKIDLDQKDSKIAEQNQTILNQDHTLKIKERDYKEKLTEMKSKSDKEVQRLKTQLGIKESLIQKEIKENNAESTKLKKDDEQILQQQGQIEKLLSQKADLEKEISELTQHETLLNKSLSE